MVKCNARYLFTILNIRDCDRQSEDSVYANSNLGYAAENN